MKKIVLCICLGFASLAHATLAEVMAAEATVTVAKAQLAAAKKGLTKLEKAEYAVATSTAKLTKLQAQ